MSVHWGDLPVIPDTESGIAAIEREQMTKPRPMEVEGPKLYQPCNLQPVKEEPYTAEQFAIDPITLHTIKLVQHSNKLRALIHSVQQQQEIMKSAGESQLLNFQPTPPFPEFTGKLPKHRPSGSLPFVPKDTESDFVKGIGKVPPKIDSVSNRKLLRKSVAAICAHAGFDTCGESVLETLTDLSHEYYLQLTGLMRNAVDTQLLNGRSNFPDVMEQVFQEMGIGSYTNLSSFYQNRIVNYHASMIRQCQELTEEYEKVKQMDYRVSDDFKPIRVKDEPLSDINFPVLDESEELIDANQVLQMEELEMGVGNTSASSLNNEDEMKWPQSVKSEPQDTKVNVLDSFDTDDNPSVPDLSQTPNLGSEGGDSIHDPGSVPVLDILSPPSIGARPPKKKKKKR